MRQLVDIVRCISRFWALAWLLPSAYILGSALPAASGEFDVEIRQITHGPKHHFFGYIGHVQNIPWNGDGRYIVALRTSFQDRMPAPGEAADVVLIDTQEGNRVEKIDESRAWNF